MKKITMGMCILLFVLLLSFGTITFSSSKEALFVWFEQLVPSMFVSMVFIRTIYDQRILHHLPLPILPRLLHIETGVFHLVLCTMFLGFPNGAMFIEQAYAKNEIDYRGAKRLLYTCSFATPSFVIMSCGLILYHSISIGFLLFATQLGSGLLLLALTRRTPVLNLSISSPHSSSTCMQSISQSIVESGKALYMIGGYLMLFMSISNVLLSLFPRILSLPLQMLGEFSSGILLLQHVSISPTYSIALCSFLLSFAGFCVHLQIMSMLSHLHISYAKFCFFRILQGILSVLLLLLCLKLFPNLYG